MLTCVISVMSLLLWTFPNAVALTWQIGIDNNGNQLFTSLSCSINVAKQLYIHFKASRIEYDTERPAFDEATFKAEVGYSPYWLFKRRLTLKWYLCRTKMLYLRHSALSPCLQSLSKHQEGGENSRQLCITYFENCPNPWVFRSGYVNAEKVLY